MPGADLNRLERAMKGITIGVVRSTEDRKAQRSLEGLEDREERLVIGIEGRAEEFPAWDEVEVTFATVFVNGTGMRDTELIRPHITYGGVCEHGGPVGFMATVMEWKTNKRDETIGATFAIAAVATDEARTFRGEVHITVTGYGAPADAYGDGLDSD